MNKILQEPEIKQKWQKVRFDEICENISIRVKNPKESGSLFYVGLEHLEPEQLKIKNHGTPDDVYATKLRFKPGQILFGKRRFYQRKLAVTDFEGICSAHMLVLEAKAGKILKEFLPLFMQSEEFYQRALMISEGSLSPTIKWRNLAKQEFVIPSLENQNLIIKIISSVDEYKQQIENLIEKIIILKKSALSQLLTKGMGHTKFKKVKWHFGSVLEIPVDWTAEVFQKFITNGPSSGLYSPIRNYGTGDKIVGLGDVFRGDVLDSEKMKKVNLTEKEKKGYILKSNDLVFSRYSLTFEGVGKCLFIPKITETILFESNTLRVSINHNIADSRYLAYYFNNEIGRKSIIRILKQVSATGITGSDLKAMKIVLPKSVQEQQKISSILSKLDEHIISLKSNLTLTNQMKKSLLNSFLSPLVEKSIIVE